MKVYEKIGKIIVESEASERTHTQKNGAEFLRNLVDWLNARSETLNDDKSPLDLIREYKQLNK